MKFPHADKFTRHAFFFTAFSLLAMGAKSCKQEVTGMVDVTLLHTNDMHMYLTPEKSNSEKNPYNLGGVARIKTLVNDIRKEKPYALLLDAGDWSEAIMPFFVDGGSSMLRIMDRMGYDAAVVGNHDFLNGPVELANTIERADAEFPLLGANKDLSGLPPSEQTRLADEVPPYAIVERNGLKIGIIGLLCNDYFYFPYFNPAKITNPVEAATKITKMLHDKEKVQVIVVLSHNKFDLNVLWAKQIPWVNVIVSGHSHVKTPQAVVTSNGGRPAYVVEAGKWTQFLGELNLNFDASTKLVTLKKYALHPVFSAIPENPEIVAMVKDNERKMAERLGQTDVVSDHIADSEDEFIRVGSQEDPYGMRELPIANLVSDGYREAVGADIGLESTELLGNGIQPGPLSTSDIVNMTPHIFGPVPGKAFPEFGKTWTLKKLTVSGQDVLTLLSVSFLAEGLGVLGHIATSGVGVLYNNNETLNKIKNISVFDHNSHTYQPLKSNGTYTLALHDGLLMALRLLKTKLFLSIDLSRIEETGVEVWQATLDHVVSVKTLRLKDYEVGSRYKSTEVDLGVYEEGIQVLPNSTSASGAVSVTVRNYGMKAASAGAFKLRLERSSADDAVFDASQNQFISAVNKSMGDISLPALATGESATIEVPWDKLSAGGIYAFRAKILGKDNLDINNEAMVHKKIPEPTFMKKIF